MGTTLRRQFRRTGATGARQCIHGPADSARVCAFWRLRVAVRPCLCGACTGPGAGQGCRRGPMMQPYRSGVSERIKRAQRPRRALPLRMRAHAASATPALQRRACRCNPRGAAQSVRTLQPPAAVGPAATAAQSKSSKRADSTAGIEPGCPEPAAAAAASAAAFAADGGMQRAALSGTVEPGHFRQSGHGLILEAPGEYYRTRVVCGGAALGRLSGEQTWHRADSGDSVASGRFRRALAIVRACPAASGAEHDAQARGARASPRPARPLTMPAPHGTHESVAAS